MPSPAIIAMVSGVVPAKWVGVHIDVLIGSWGMHLIAFSQPQVPAPETYRKTVHPSWYWSTCHLEIYTPSCQSTSMCMCTCVHTIDPTSCSFIFVNSLIRPTILRKSQKRIGPAHFFSFSKDVSLHCPAALQFCNVCSNEFTSTKKKMIYLLYRLQKHLLFLPHKNTSTGTSQQETA